MAKPTITTTEDGYYLTVNGESSDIVPFGNPLEVVLGGKVWLSYVDLPDDTDSSTETESVLDSWLYEVKPVDEADIEFDDDEDEDDDQDEDDAQGDDPDEVVIEEPEFDDAVRA